MINMEKFWKLINDYGGLQKILELLIFGLDNCGDQYLIDTSQHIKTALKVYMDRYNRYPET